MAQEGTFAKGRDLGKPVVSTNQAVMWAGLHITGVEEKIAKLLVWLVTPRRHCPALPLALDVRLRMWYGRMHESGRPVSRLGESVHWRRRWAIAATDQTTMRCAAQSGATPAEE